MELNRFYGRIIKDDMHNEGTEEYASRHRRYAHESPCVEPVVTVVGNELICASGSTSEPLASGPSPYPHRRKKQGLGQQGARDLCPKCRPPAKAGAVHAASKTELHVTR